MKRILIVDDSALIRLTVVGLLEGKSGFRVCGVANNGSEGVAMAKELHPDLIVLDMAMPVMNGIDASRILKRLMPAVPIVMFTTFMDPQIGAAALAAGANVVIDKTQCADTLIDSIEQLLLSEVSSPL